MEDKTQKSKLVEEEPLLPPPNRDRMRNLGEGNAKTFIISLVATVVVLALMTFVGGVGFVTKQDFAKNMEGTVATLEQAKVDLAKAKSDVASAIQSVPTAITAQVNSSITLATNQWSSQLGAVSDRVSGLVTGNQANADKISDLTSRLNSNVGRDTELSEKISVLEAAVKALQDKVTVLEASIVPTANQTSGVITAEIQLPYLDYIALTPASGNSIVINFPVRVKLTNTTAKALTDIKLNIGFSQLSYYETPLWTASFPQLAGGSTTWINYGGTYSQSMMFVNGWDLTLNANEKKTLNLTLSLNLARTLINEMRWEPGIEVEDFAYK